MDGSVELILRRILNSLKVDSFFKLDS